MPIYNIYRGGTGRQSPPARLVVPARGGGLPQQHCTGCPCAKRGRTCRPTPACLRLGGTISGSPRHQPSSPTWAYFPCDHWTAPRGTGCTPACTHPMPTPPGLHHGSPSPAQRVSTLDLLLIPPFVIPVSHFLFWWSFCHTLCCTVSWCGNLSLSFLTGLQKADCRKPPQVPGLPRQAEMPPGLLLAESATSGLRVF